MTYERNRFPTGLLAPGAKTSFRQLRIPMSVNELAGQQNFDKKTLQELAIAPRVTKAPHEELLRFLRYCKQYGFTNKEISRYLAVTESKIARICVDFFIRKPAQRDIPEDPNYVSRRPKPSKPKEYFP